MSPNAPRSILEARSLSVPGKVFLLGEYAVLAGQPALVAAVGPRFSWNRGEPGAVIRGRAAAHPKSPAGRLIAAARMSAGTVASEFFGEHFPGTFDDPHGGKGGFGASTAEFAMTYQLLAPSLGWGLDWISCWKKYQELYAADGVPPSGADLAVQMTGGTGIFDPVVPAVQALATGGVSQALLVFSAAGLPGRKVATHEHLKSDRLKSLDPRSEWISALSECVAEGIGAWRKDDIPAFGKVLTRFAETLAAEGLEADGARGERARLSLLAGVHGLKGAGGMLSDALVAAVDPARHDAFIAVAASLGLRLVSKGIPREEGILNESH